MSGMNELCSTVQNYIILAYLGCCCSPTWYIYSF